LLDAWKDHVRSMDLKPYERMIQLMQWDLAEGGREVPPLEGVGGGRGDVVAQVDPVVALTQSIQQLCAGMAQQSVNQLRDTQRMVQEYMAQPLQGQLAAQQERLNQVNSQLAAMEKTMAEGQAALRGLEKQLLEKQEALAELDRELSKKSARVARKRAREMRGKKDGGVVERPVVPERGVVVGDGIPRGPGPD